MRKHIACWILKATDIHSKYVILTAFPLQQWLYERASVSPHMYIARPVNRACIKPNTQITRRLFRTNFTIVLTHGPSPPTGFLI
jgi:hypothetical protein